MLSKRKLKCWRRGRDSNPPPSFCQKYWQISALTTNATSHLRPSRVCILPVFLENQIGDILVAMVVRFGLIYGLLGRAPKIILGTRELEWCREGVLNSNTQLILCNLLKIM